jgi:hypothetical protein
MSEGVVLGPCLGDSRVRDPSDSDSGRGHAPAASASADEARRTRITASLRMTTMRAKRVLAVACLAVFIGGCDGGCDSGTPADERASSMPPGGAVLYTIGVSTDPYGDDRPQGFGVASGLVTGHLEKVELRSGNYGWFGGADWVERGRILVHRKAPPLRRPVIFRFVNGRLERSGLAPFTSGTAYRWSHDRELLALEPPAPCKPGQRSLFQCYRGGGRIFIADGDGSAKRFLTKGMAPDWTPDGKLVFYRTTREWARGRAVVLDIASGRKTFRDRYWVNEQPLPSADGRYLADRQGRKERTLVVVKHADGRLVRTFSTPYIVSMLAWSPDGHSLAYTTSGFPAPHELFLVDTATGKRRRIFVSGAAHFDWITWSPDGRLLLLDGDNVGGWRLFSATSGKQVRRLPRLGGRPLWCCPVNAYDARGQRSP